MLARALKGGALLVGVRFLTRISDLITMLVLARLLQPAGFGLVAVATSIVVVLEAALDLPLHNVLLRQPEITKGLCDTAFTLSLVRGLAIGALLVGLSFPLAHFYQNEKFSALICAISVAPICRGMISPALAAFQRKLSYWRDFAIEASGKFLAAVIAISVALTTHSYWSIAAATVSGPIIMVVVSYALAPYRPGLSIAYLSEFLEFLGWNTPAQIIGAINWQVERLLLGRLQPPAQLGLFSTANDIAGIPYMVVFGPIIRPIYAALVHADGDARQLRSTYEKTSATLLAIGLPMFVGESLIAEPMVRLVLGEKWLGAAPLARVLALSFIPAVYAMAAGPLFMALGDTKLLFKRNLLECSVKVPAVFYGAIHFGFLGVIIARMFSEIVAAMFCLIMVHRRIQMPLQSQIFAGWRSAASAGIMAISIQAASRLFIVPNGIVASIAQIAVLVPIGAVAYVAAHVGLWFLVGRPDGLEHAALGKIQSLAETYGRGQRLLSSEEPVISDTAQGFINALSDPLFESINPDAFVVPVRIANKEPVFQQLSRSRSARARARARFQQWIGP